MYTNIQFSLCSLSFLPFLPVLCVVFWWLLCSQVNLTTARFGRRVNHDYIIKNSTNRRFLSTTAAASSGPSSLSLLLQRLSSFAVGAGLMALATQYYIFEDVRNGNLAMLQKQRELEARLDKLEGKKKY